VKAAFAKIAAARAWRSLETELRRWGDGGHTPKFWWRDDDARGMTEPLARLAGIASQNGAPLLLAVVPGPEAETLRPVLAQGLVKAAQHGVDHLDRSGGEGPRTEFHSLAATEDVAQQLVRGRRRLGDLPVEPIYVPPWNTLTENVAEALVQAGFKAVSGFGGAMVRGSGPARLDAHLDLMRWSPAPRFRGETQLLEQMRRRLVRLRKAKAWSEPTGLLTHHLDHDEPAWRFLDELLRRLQAGRRTEWVSAAAVLGDALTPPYNAAAVEISSARSHASAAESWSLRQTSEISPLTVG
jgi:hypothetical protein